MRLPSWGGAPNFRVLFLFVVILFVAIVIKYGENILSEIHFAKIEWHVLSQLVDRWHHMLISAGAHQAPGESPSKRLDCFNAYRTTLLRAAVRSVARRLVG